LVSLLLTRPPPRSPLFPYTTLFRSPKVAAAIAKACTLDNALPQGAPTSPILSNLICAKMDAELSRYALANKCIYTRYADDLTFRSEEHTSELQSRENLVCRLLLEKK